MNERYDAVIVGGGIAGAALAATLARADKAILVIERQVTFRDRVRGEVMSPWGVAAAQALDLMGAMVEAGGAFSRAMVLYDEVVPFPIAADMTAAVGGIDGLFNVGHPDLCEALLTLAAKEGAKVRRGVGDVAISLGDRPRVRYHHEDTGHEAGCRLVVGADGRHSVVRKALARDLESAPVRCMFGGMLVDGIDGWPDLESAFGTEGNLHYLVFPRPGGKARLYLGHAQGTHPELTGTGKEQAFLNAFRFSALPRSQVDTWAKPAGPAAFFPSCDTAIAGEPAGDGAVLIGDAAGWSDPVIGQGLSVAITDALRVSEALLASDDWSPALFTDYGRERRELMRRIRVSAMLHNALFSDFSPEGKARRGAFLDATAAVVQQLPHDPADALLFIPPVAALYAGHIHMPAEAYSPENIDRILNLGQDKPVPPERWTTL